MTKYIIFVCSTIIICIFFSSWFDKRLRITFCDVGQGDATLLSVGSTQLLIDTGPNERVMECLNKNIPFWDKTIEFFVLTHMDSDHIGGASQVLDHFSVRYIFVNPSDKKTSDFTHLEQVISRKINSKTKLIHTFLGQNIQLTEQIEGTVINPNIQFPQVEMSKNQLSETILSDFQSKYIEEKIAKISENNRSIALFIIFNKVSILLPGGLEEKGELAVIQTGLLNRVAILKVGHHGSKTSSKPGFIDILQPEIAVISSGKNNAYNHPNPQVVELFTEIGAQIYQTKSSGEITFISDGVQVWEE